MKPLDQLMRTARAQHGAFSRTQAHDAGMTDKHLAAEVARGSLVRTGPHSFRAALAPDTPIARLVGLVLDVGEPCWIAERTAAALLQYDGFRLTEPFVLVVLDDRSVRRTGAVIRRTNDLAPIDRTRIDGLPVTSGARTVIDLARDHTVEQLAAAYDSGLRDGRFSEDLFHRRLVALRSKGRFGVPKLLDVVEGREATRGGHSWLEREFLRLCHAARLPRPDAQRVLARAGGRLVRVDFAFPGTRLVVEVLGYRYHRTPSQLARDAERTNALMMAGHVVLQFAYAHVVDDPAGTIAQVREALDRLQLARRPRRWGFRAG